MSVNRAIPSQMAVLPGGGSLALACDLAEQLGMCNLSACASVEGWIVNTSIKIAHQRFGGFLKVLLEEVLIALRDEHEVLHDSQEFFTVPSKTFPERH